MSISQWKINDIQVYAIANNQQLLAKQWRYLLYKIVPFLHQDILRYRNWRDRQATLFGKLLLRKFLLEQTGTAKQLATIKLDAYKKPFIAGNIEFNISHTDGMVVCAVSQNIKLGIDIERIQTINLTEFTAVFTKEEYALIDKNKQQKDCFFNIWTRKEALMKADGRGFYLNPKQLSALPDQQVIAGQNWIIKQLSFPKEFVAHLALATEAPVNIQFLNIKDL